MSTPSDTNYPPDFLQQLQSEAPEARLQRQLKDALAELRRRYGIVSNRNTAFITGTQHFIKEQLAAAELLSLNVDECRKEFEEILKLPPPGRRIPI